MDTTALLATAAAVVGSLATAIAALYRELRAQAKLAQESADKAAAAAAARIAALEGKLDAQRAAHDADAVRLFEWQIAFSEKTSEQVRVLAAVAEHVRKGTLPP